MFENTLVLMQSRGALDRRIEASIFMWWFNVRGLTKIKQQINENPKQ